MVIAIDTLCVTYIMMRIVGALCQSSSWQSVCHEEKCSKDNSVDILNRYISLKAFILIQDVIYVLVTVLHRLPFSRAA